MSEIERLWADGVATVRLNRPDIRNALTAPMQAELISTFDELHHDRETRVVVIEGAGSSFCAGGHIGALSKEKEQGPGTADDERNAQFEGRQRLRRLQRVIQAIRGCEKPVLASIDGPAVGGGFDLALACDVRFASSRAKFGEVFARIGLFPGTGGTFLLPQVVGVSQALDLIWSGEVFDAERAYALGIVRSVHADRAALDRTVAEYSARLTLGPPLAISLAKAAVYRCMNQDLAAAFDFAATAETITLTSSDHREGVTAFRDKRPPMFRGR
ncbi:enoyl-CoA hydratase/isomerase family protein [Ilumatobacter coccineus]|uniref:Putative enoyl-CoA hydratase n=1 Tax=Ilumatobacter coccineus (strain NBRC 103263 / KCTC 29153 / YM16-304) TaxID=1313172 RepID=A0A6C7EDK7_ILUCY|nr:enoyl-CoA hydratase-related protein [Ilumatobacter coccineus]BAN02076.1 putative enoyl-CoA hydratase [Ilumatobacter coccineus YM16-304]